jgi:DNA mismatch endonuclease, patch repair protein
MADIVHPSERSRMMSGIRSKNTQPELLLRKALHARGFRYKLHVKDLPGKPDIVLPKWKALIFVHGCFWHWHQCSLSKLPETRKDFWEKKLTGNRARDIKALLDLQQAGWDCAVVWECALRGRNSKQKLNDITLEIIEWLQSKRQKYIEIKG